MNIDNLHELINRYEENLDLIYGTEHYELFKWQAMKTWQQEWKKPADCFATFADRFNAARKDFSLFVDNSRMHPSTGVIKIWEQDPQAVEQLFSEVLFADAHNDASVVQEHMDTFLDKYEGLRQKYFPGNWSYKQDRHSASVFLALNDPSFNYVYKSSEALTMAKYIGYETDIGSGAYFKLPVYYQMCDLIVSALKDHPSLLEEHFKRMDDRCYEDRSLHLLAFDLMYCSRTYRFYTGLIAPESTRIRKKSTSSSKAAEALARKEEERNTKIAQLQQEIDELESVADNCEDISLIGVQVSSDKYGTGTVVSQDINKIGVQFEEVLKSFVLDKKYSSRPRFEDDDTIVEAFTIYGQRMEKINSLKRQLEFLRK